MGSLILLFPEAPVAQCIHLSANVCLGVEQSHIPEQEWGSIHTTSRVQAVRLHGGYSERLRQRHREVDCSAAGCMASVTRYTTHAFPPGGGLFGFKVLGGNTTLSAAPSPWVVLLKGAVVEQ